MCGFIVTPHALLNERASVLFQRRETVYCPNRATFHLQTEVVLTLRMIMSCVHCLECLHGRQEVVIHNSTIAV
jgi:hypothetical protein